MITVQEAARRLNRSIEQVRRYLREGKLKGQRIGQQWFIEESALGTIYRPGRPQVHRISEATAALEIPKMNREIKAVIENIDANREAIRARLGRDVDVDVVEMLRIDREEH
jgi:excisionase family DNA binding protein